MAVEFIFRCDSCNKPGPKTTTGGEDCRYEIKILRAAASDEGFVRLRPADNGPARDLCPRCFKKHEAEKARAAKERKPNGKAEAPKAQAPAKPKAKAKAKAK